MTTRVRNGSFFEDLADRLEAADGAAVVYGIRDEPHWSGLSAAVLGAIMVKGNPRNRTPPRDFFAQAREDLRVISPRLLKRAAKDINRGVPAFKALETLRVAAHEALVRSIDTFDEPRNAPSTIRRKGFDDPLRHRGDLLKAADAEIED